MTRVTLTASSTASSRTKNRLREHPGTFSLKETSHPQCLDGAEGIFVTHDDGWLGWFPTDEVHVEVDFA